MNMRYSKKQLLLSVLIGTSCIATPKTLFEEMIEEMNEMEARFERRMNRFHEEIKRAFSAPLNNGLDAPGVAITENKTQNCVEIVVSPLSIQEKSFDATMDQEANSMVINTPAGSLHVQSNRHLISVGFNHQIKQESDTKGVKNQNMFSSFSNQTKTISAEIALEESHIEYDQAAQKLAISIPFRKKVLTKIPVCVKESQSGKEAPKSIEK